MSYTLQIFRKCVSFEDSQMILLPYFAISYGFNFGKNAKAFQSILKQSLFYVTKKTLWMYSVYRLFLHLRGLRLFKRLRLLLFKKLYKAMFIWEATFIRDLRVSSMIHDIIPKFTQIYHLLDVRTDVTGPDLTNWIEIKTNFCV